MNRITNVISITIVMLLILMVSLTIVDINFNIETYKNEANCIVEVEDEL